MISYLEENLPHIIQMMSLPGRRFFECGGARDPIKPFAPADFAGLCPVAAGRSVGLNWFY